jgi:hypothetical protein
MFDPAEKAFIGQAVMQARRSVKSPSQLVPECRSIHLKNPAGDRVKVVMSGKFLSYKEY